MSAMTANSDDCRTSTYLVGMGVAHSIAPPMHDFVARSLGLNWRFQAQECATVEEAVSLFRQPTFAGGVVTMPFKMSIMQHLDGLDDHATLVKACNNVYRAADGSLRGTNTDWRGIKGCLASATDSTTSAEAREKPALLIGAGGAARAAIYVLHHELRCHPIYVVNRDAAEVQDLADDARVYGKDVELVHLQDLEVSKDMIAERGQPFYVVGTVPDLPPQSPSEIEAHKILDFVFANAASSGGSKGVLLDMCFKPRRTRTIHLAEKHNWTCVEGVDIIGHQIEEQYRLWCTPAGDHQSPITDQIQKGAWKVLRQAADESKMIN